MKWIVAFSEKTFKNNSFSSIGQDSLSFSLSPPPPPSTPFFFELPEIKHLYSSETGDFTHTDILKTSEKSQCHFVILTSDKNYSSHCSSEPNLALREPADRSGISIRLLLQCCLPKYPSSLLTLLPSACSPCQTITLSVSSDSTHTLPMALLHDQLWR